MARSAISVDARPDSPQNPGPDARRRAALGNTARKLPFGLLLAGLAGALPHTDAAQAGPNLPRVAGPPGVSPPPADLRPQPVGGRSLPGAGRFRRAPINVALEMKESDRGP